MDRLASQSHPAERLASKRSLTILYHHRTRSRDGQSVHIDALIGAIREAGHQVIVVGPRQIAAKKESLNRRLLPRLAYELLEFSYNLIELWKLGSAVIRHKPAALYQRSNVFMLSGLWSARLFGLPYLLEVNAPLAIERGKFGGLAWSRLATWSEHTAWRGADHVLVVSNVLAKELESARVSRSRIHVTPNGIDLSRLLPRDRNLAKQELGLGDALVLGFVGFVREWHGLDQIVDLLAIEPALSKARFLIIGDGPACPGLRAQAEHLKVIDRVVVTGVVPHERLPEYLSAIDVALQPEVTPYASPLKLFEYMAMGRAIVAPDGENIKEILEHEVDSLLFRSGDKHSLSDAIRRFAADEALRARCGMAAARKVAERGLTWQRNAEKVLALIQETSRRKKHKV